MKLEPQIEELYRMLDRELDNFPSGTKFYSVRKLMDKFKCHRGVLDRTLERLEADRLIERVPQVGIFSSVTRRPNAYKVLLAVLDWPSEVTLEWNRMAGVYTETHHGWQLCKTMLVPDSDTIASLNTDGFDAAIIRTPRADISTDEMKWLASLSIPVVLLNADTGSFPVSNVRSADAGGAILACHHLYQCGHRQIAIVQSEPHSLPTDKQAVSFDYLSKLLGIRLIKIDCMTASGEYAQYKAYLGMKQYLEEHDGAARVRLRTAARHQYHGALDRADRQVLPSRPDRRLRRPRRGGRSRVHRDRRDPEEEDRQFQGRNTNEAHRTGLRKNTNSQ